MLLLTCLPVQNNLGPQPNGMSFRIVENDIEWETEAVTQNGEEMLAPEFPVACWQERTQIAEWLVNVLFDGERRASEVQSEAPERGFTAMTLHRVVVGLDIHVQQMCVDAMGRWFRSLPQTLSPASRAPSDHLPRSVPDTISEHHAKTPLTNAAHARER